jgi:intracellular septation protein
MKILFDIFPVLLFFIVFKLFGVYPATGAAIVATIAQVAWVKWHHGKVDTTLWVSLGIIVIFGGATLLLHNENFIKWKPTVLYWFFATAILFSRAFFDKNLMRLLLQGKIDLPNKVWQYLNFAWSGFFAMLGGLNLYVAYHFSMDTWVDFKLFGTMGMMLVFILLQALVLSKYIKEEHNKS